MYHGYPPAQVRCCDARTIAHALSPRPKRTARGWLSKCPAHADRTPSLSIADAADGQRVLVKCFTGCQQAAVIDALRDLGLWPRPHSSVRTPIMKSGRRPRPVPACDDVTDSDARTRAALIIWERSGPLPGTLA